MKKKTKASKQKLNNLLMILLLTAVLLIMSTYAWFTANRTVNIDAIDVKVATSSGLQISADGITWKTVLTKDDVFSAYNTYGSSVNQLPSIMAPVSSALELDANGHLKMFFGKVEANLDTNSDTYGQYLLTSTLQTDVASNKVTTTGEFDKGYYMAFDVFLKVETQASELYMSGSVTEPTTVKGLANAARVALIKGPNTAAVDAASGEIQALPTTGGTVMMWEPNADAHTINGVNNATALGWASITAGEGNATIAYDGVKAEKAGVVLADATATKDPDSFAAATPTWATPKTGTPSMLMPGGLAAGVTKYRIYLWVEGQDVDCENNASGTDIQYDLSFSLDPFATATPTPTP